MARNRPLNRVEEQAVLANDINELLQPETIIWAKLRGYPWWPGLVKSFSDAPPELSHIAKTQYKPGTVVAVYFFGSHDFSLVPAEALRPFEANFDLFSSRSAGTRFTKALVEAREPEKYRSYEQVRQQGLNSSPTKEAPKKRKRGRPPKNKNLAKKVVSSPPPSYLRLKKRPRRYDSLGNVTRSFILYCRIKLQKILLRQTIKPAEISIAEKILSALGEDPISLEILERTKISRVLRLATLRGASGGDFGRVIQRIESLLQTWRKSMEDSLHNIGL